MHGAYPTAVARRFGEDTRDKTGAVPLTEADKIARWYVVHTRPSKEVWALANLERQGFRAFLPQTARTVRHARKVREVVRPLFPRYLFVALDIASDQWWSIRGTYGVSALLMDGERPRTTPPGLVEELVALAGRNFNKARVAGERVRLLRGPFADQLGQIVEMKDADRVSVLLKILGSEREVIVDSGNLWPAGP